MKIQGQKHQNSIRLVQSCANCSHFVDVKRDNEGRKIGSCMWHGKNICVQADKRDSLNRIASMKVCDDYYPRDTYIKIVGKLVAHKGVRFRKTYEHHDPTYVEVECEDMHE